jgi:hypothetical protein
MLTLGARAWWAAMRDGNTKTRATIANIIYDWRQRRIDPVVIHTLLEAIGARWESSPDSEPPERQLPKAVDTDPGAYLCKGRRIDATSTACSRVMSAQELLEFNLDASKLHVPVKGFFKRAQIEDLERWGPGIAAINTMRTRRPLAWITRTDDLARARGPGDPAAPNRVRDRLGMRHVQEDDYLVEIRYPPDALDRSAVAIPTFIEGCPSLIYRSKDAPDGWGRAVDLVGLADGLPEAVHTEVPFTSAFAIHDLGPLRPPSPSLDWELFLEGMPIQWDAAELDDLEGA